MTNLTLENDAKYKRMENRKLCIGGRIDRIDFS